MRLVNLQSAGGIASTDRLGTRMLERVLFRFRRVPESGVVHGRDGEVLRDTLDPGRETVHGRSVGFGEGDLGRHQLSIGKKGKGGTYLDHRVVRDRTGSVGEWRNVA